MTTKKTADGGIDGRLYFLFPDEREFKSMIIEVKGGKSVGIDVVLQIQGVLSRDHALMAGLVIMEDLGVRKMANFRKAMLDNGDLVVNGVPYPRMQMLTVPKILGGKRFRTPSVARGKSQSAQPNLPLF